MIKGALVEMTNAFGVTKPNVVVFQFNPETLRHSWTQPLPSVPGSHPLAAPGMPGETFSFSLALDVTDPPAPPAPALDALGRIRTPPPPRESGIYTRLAALEMLMFPDQNGPTTEERQVPAELLRTVLFVWGALRIVPVRVVGLTITETLFDASLNPTHADAQIELRVLTSTDLELVTGPLKDVAAAAYDYSQLNRERLTAVNLAVEAGTIDLLPFPRP